jgi:hypothetical protein
MPRASWLAVLGEYVVHEWVVEEERLDLDGDDCAAHLQRVRMRATVLGEDRSGPFVISDVWRRRPKAGGCGAATRLRSVPARCRAPLQGTKD